MPEAGQMEPEKEARSCEYHGANTGPAQRDRLPLNVNHSEIQPSLGRRLPNGESAVKKRKIHDCHAEADQTPPESRLGKQLKENDAGSKTDETQNKTVCQVSDDTVPWRSNCQRRRRSLNARYKLRNVG